MEDFFFPPLIDTKATNAKGLILTNGPIMHLLKAMLDQQLGIKCKHGQ